MILSACGLVCTDCEYFNTTCTGCHNVKGSTFWAREMMPDKTCPMYGCAVNKKGLKDCGACDELPCKIFRDMKDPKTTDEEHLRMIDVRVARLRAN